MTIMFSEDELEWIDKKAFNWTIKDGCPEELKKSIEKKFELLKINNHVYKSTDK